LFLATTAASTSFIALDEADEAALVKPDAGGA
jgi:hypothetical protein